MSDVEVIERKVGKWAVCLSLSGLARGNTIKEMSIS